jgi:PAS domain S-box-containing protein
MFGCAVGAALYYGTSAYYMREAEERVLDLLMENRALQEFVQQNACPGQPGTRLENLPDSGRYSTEQMSTSCVTRRVREYLNEDRRRNGLPPVSYRVAALNPRNQANAAEASDRQLIEFFDSHRDQKMFRQIVATDSGKYLQVALPFIETGDDCLRCHGNPASAPQNLVTGYGTSAGFHAEAGKIRAVETIEAPLESDILRARLLFLALLAAFLVMSTLSLVVSVLRNKVRSRTAELAASELKHRSLAEDLPCFVCSFLPNGTVTFVNRLLASYFNTEPERLVGKNIKEVVRPDVLDEAASTFQRLTPDEPIGVKELKLVNRDESTRWHRWTFRGSFDADGKVVLYQTFGEDITERRQANEIIKESEARFSTVFHSSPIGISISRLDDGLVIDVNDAMLRLTGFRREEVVGHSSAELNLYSDHASRDRLIALLQEHGSVRNVEGTLRTRSGSIQETMLSAEIIQLDGRPHMLASLMDERLETSGESAARKRTTQPRAA